jgi:hypothetical protein
MSQPQTSTYRCNSKEFFCPVYSTDNAFGVSSYPINPGLPNNFIRSHVFAKAFDYYEPEFQFEFQTALPTSAAGTVGFYPDSNVYDNAPSSWGEVASNGMSVSGPVWATELSRPIPREFFKTRKTFMTRAHAISGSYAEYDCGVLHVATNGVPVGTLVGYIFCTNRSVFSRPTVDVTVISQKVWGVKTEQSVGPSVTNPLSSANLVEEPADPGNLYPAFSPVFIDADGSLAFKRPFTGFLLIQILDAHNPLGAWTALEFVNSSINTVLTEFGVVFAFSKLSGPSLVSAPDDSMTMIDGFFVSDAKGKFSINIANGDATTTMALTIADTRLAILAVPVN